MKNGNLNKWPFVIAIAFVFILATFFLPLVVRTFFVQAFKIPSGAMEPTLLVGDHILVNKGATSLDKLKRKDIIVFVYPKDPSKDFVKRLVGLPGDVLEIRDKELYINGKLSSEDYVVHKDPQVFSSDQNPRDNMGPIKVPPNQVFVLGDNRDLSFDSRFWGFVGENDIIGKVTAIYWSLDSNNKRVRFDRIGMKVH